MRSLFRIAAALSLVTTVASCNLLKKMGAGDAGAEEAGATAATTVDAATAAPAAPLAANVDDIARFPDEAKLENVGATTQRWYQAREVPQVGKVVGQLAKGTLVTEIAQRDKYFLIVWDDAKVSKRLMGWIHQDAFAPTVAVDAGLKPLVCTAPEVPLFSDGPFCGRSCTSDTDCPSGRACKGSAQKFTNGKIGDSVQVCTDFATPSADAGAPKPPVSDAGPPAADAGAPPPADAGPTPTTASKDIIDPGAGACPAGFFMVLKDKRCHRECPSGIAPKDCKDSAFCGKCDGRKVCNAVRDFCK